MPSAPSGMSQVELKATSRLFPIEDQEDLVGVGLRVGRDLLARAARARDVAAGRIADHAGEIADQEHDVVAEILQLPQLVELDRVPEMEVGTGRIEAFLDSQWRAAGELRRELRLDQQFVGAAAEDRELVLDVGGHDDDAALLMATPVAGRGCGFRPIPSLVQG